MKSKGKRQKEKVRSRILAAARRGAPLTFPFFLFSLALSSSAHEPITTKVRFNKEVIRIFQRSCLACHRPGGIAFSLASYDEARPWAKAIKEEVLEKRMPPWHPVKGYGEFRNAPSFTQRDVDLLVNWVEGGAPKGDDKDMPEGPLFSGEWQLGKPDLVLKPDSESNISANADEYRTFVLNTGLKENRWVTAIDLLPGNASVVHCASFCIVRADARSGGTTVHIRNDDAKSARLPVPSVFATWMPGQRTAEFGDGVAQLLPAASRIEVKIHYRGSGEAAKDLSSVGLYFAKSPPRRQVQELTINNPAAVIPVAAEPQRVKASLAVRSETTAIAVRPRVHPLLVSLQATAYFADGSQQVLIWTRGYQFDWEPTYHFKRPVALPAGTRIEVTAYFDNSDDNQNNPNPAKTVGWSELIGGESLCALLVANNIARADAASTH